MGFAVLGDELIGALAAVKVGDLLPRAQLGAFPRLRADLFRVVGQPANDLDDVEFASVRARLGFRARKERVAAFVVFRADLGRLARVGRRHGREWDPIAESCNR